MAHLALSVGWTEPFCGEGFAFLSLALGHRFYPQARPLTTELCPPTQTGRGVAVHTWVTQQEPTGRLVSVWWSGEHTGHGWRAG